MTIRATFNGIFKLYMFSGRTFNSNVLLTIEFTARLSTIDSISMCQGAMGWTFEMKANNTLITSKE